MAEYRAYAVGDDGHFIGFEPVICDDDNQAIDKAKRLVNGHDMELWNGDRFVARLMRKPECRLSWAWLSARVACNRCNGTENRSLLFRF
jgi:hypothetical protein